MMGAEGLTHATAVAVLAANYVAERLQDHFPVLYRGHHDRVAHECILDLRGLTKSSGVSVDDVAKRLIDYGFHAPTMSFPVAGTLMVEPTESEDLGELDRFCEAMIAIRGEIDRVEAGEWSPEDSPLRGAPHTAASVLTGHRRARLLRRGGGVPDRPRPGQVLAAGRPHRPGVRRPQPVLRLPAARGLRLTGTVTAGAALPGCPRPLPGRPPAALDRRRRARRRRARLGRAVAGASDDRGHPVPDRLDHQDDHRGAGAAVPRRGLLDLDDPIGEAPARDRLRRRDAALAARPRLGHAERARRAVVGAVAGRAGRGAARRERRLAARSSAPGEHYHYSNLGFALLGEAVARLRRRAVVRRWCRRGSSSRSAMTRTSYLPEEPHARGLSVHHLAGTLPRAAARHRRDGAGRPAVEHDRGPGAASPRSSPSGTPTCSPTRR